MLQLPLAIRLPAGPHPFGVLFFVHICFFLTDVFDCLSDGTNSPANERTNEEVRPHPTPFWLCPACARARSLSLSLSLFLLSEVARIIFRLSLWGQCFGYKVFLLSP